MKRNLINVFTLVSVAMCLATIVWIIAGYCTHFAWVHADHVTTITLASGEQRSATTWYRLETKQRRIRLWWIDPNPVVSLDRTMNGWDLEVRVLLDRPVWNLLLLTIATAIMPTLALRRIMQRKRRTRTNHCARCGYDLRASPERCPECGAIRETATA
jgi:hypothetical protein